MRPALISRPMYMSQILPLMDRPVIKVLTGIRRCGKSSILNLLKQTLLDRGVPEERILQINLENLDFSHLRTAEALHAHVKLFIKGSEPHYVLLDEIQEVEGWEKALNSLQLNDALDLVVTGSNSRLLSSELATYIAGRYVEIPIWPLSFREFIDFGRETYPEANEPASAETRRREFDRYLRLGGFPAIRAGMMDEMLANQIVRDIYASVLLRDAVQRHGIRQIELFERVVRYAFDNLGKPFSAKGIADFFKSQQRKVDPATVYSYLDILEEAFILRRVARFDLRGKEHLRTQEKYYAGDTSLVTAVMGYRERQISGLLENVVCLEMLRRGYRVSVGKLDAREIDFIAERQSERLYVQVTYRMSGSKETAEREYAPLLAIRDHYPKWVVSMDDAWQDNVDGIRQVHVADFLMAENWGLTLE